MALLLVMLTVRVDVEGVTRLFLLGVLAFFGTGWIVEQFEASRSAEQRRRDKIERWNREWREFMGRWWNR